MTIFRIVGLRPDLQGSKASPQGPVPHSCHMRLSHLFLEGCPKRELWAPKRETMRPSLFGAHGLIGTTTNEKASYEAFLFVVVPIKPWALERDSPVVSLLVPKVPV